MSQSVEGRFASRGGRNGCPRAELPVSILLHRRAVQSRRVASDEDRESARTHKDVRAMDEADNGADRRPDESECAERLKQCSNDGDNASDVFWREHARRDNRGAEHIAADILQQAAIVGVCNDRLSCTLRVFLLHKSCTIFAL